MKDKLGFGVLFGILVLAIIVVAQIISGAIIMFVSNIILEWLDKKTMTLGVGIAISVLLTIVGAVLRRDNSDKN